MLMKKLDAMVKVVTKRNIMDMELMNLEARTLDDSSYTLADSMEKLVFMPGLIPGSLKLYFACTLIEDSQKRIILNGMSDDKLKTSMDKILV